MAELSDIVNTPIEVKIGDRTFKIRRLSIEDVFASLESMVIADRMEAIKQIAETLEGEEKIDYLRGATRDLPRGEELQEMVQEKLQSISGVRHVFYHAIKEDQPDIKPEDLKGFLTGSTGEEISGIMEWMCGLSENGIESADTEKKTVEA